MHKILVLDLDGTIFDHKKGIHPKTIEGIKKIKEKGIPIIIATGRNIQTIRPIAIKINLMNTGVPFIGQNGAITFSFDKNDTVNFKSVLLFSRDETEKMFEIGIKNRVHIFACAEDEDIIYKNVKVSKLQKLMKNGNDRLFIKYKDINTILSPVIKFIIYGNRQRMIKVREECIKNNHETFSFSYIKDKKQTIEVVSNGVNKANALLKIVNSMNIKPEEIVYFGDSENDYEALKMAGHSVCMENSDDKIKSVSSAIAGKCNEGAVGVYLEDNAEKLFGKDN